MTNTQQVIEATVDDLILEIQKLPDAPKKERFPDREGGLLIPNHNIAGLKALVSELERVKAREEKLEAALYRDWQSITEDTQDEGEILLWTGDATQTVIGFWDRDEEAEGGQCWRELGGDGERIEPLPTLWLRIPKPSYAREREALADKEEK